jgi:glycosyltransferase involved in cell wall biosynthesis
MCRLLDAIVTVSPEQKEIAIRYFAFQHQRVHVIPNIVRTPFWNDGGADRRSDIVLCTGSITMRKGQLDLIEAAAGADFRVQIAGGCVPGEERYFEAVMTRIANLNNVDYLGDLDSDASELVDAYHRATGFVLLSTSETQPLGLLEATAAGCAILVLDRPYVNQAPFSTAMRVSNRSPRAVRDAIRELLGEPADFVLNRSRIDNMHPERVAEAALRLYLSLRQ